MPVTGHSDYESTAEFYDYGTLYRDRPDLPFFVDAAKEAGGGVLELGCGTGRILIPTARAGVSIVGLDASPSMLAVCAARLGAESADVQARVCLVQGSMTDFELGQTFALVTLPFRPFQHLISVEEQLACLRCIHRHLEPHGRIILDLFNPSLDALVAVGTQEGGNDPEFIMPDGRRVLRRDRVVSRDRYNQVNQVELIYYVTYPDGRHERLVNAFPMRYLFRFEVEHLLARCGFAVDQVYADYTKTPYGAKYPGELIFVAHKQAQSS